MANRAETPEERRKREAKEAAQFTGSRSQGSLGGIRTESYKPDVVFPAPQDTNDPNVLRGDKSGAYKGPEKKKKSIWRSIMRIIGRNG